jgi:ATP-dependent DNA ligase
MLAKLVRELPSGDYIYEPKWDGFRCLAAREDDDVMLVSRHGRPFGRYFPELDEALRGLDETDFTVDGEILAEGAGGFEFAALLSRLHPAASRVEELRRRNPARLIAFDLVWIRGRDLRHTPFVTRRQLLESLLSDASPLVAPTPTTRDAAIASRWLRPVAGNGLDGVVAKRADLGYEPGRRSMLKVKLERTADCVVAGMRWMMDRRALGSLLLGLYDDDGRLRHVGVASSFSEAARRQLFDELSSLAIPLEEHPWAEGFLIERSPLGRLKGAAGRWTPDMAMDWVPIRPERVCEVRYDRFDADRFRHPARFVRWRPDRDAESCGFDQLRDPAVDPGDPAVGSADPAGSVSPTPRRI